MNNEAQEFNSTDLRVPQLIPVGPDRLTEPDLSYFLALRAQFHAAQVQSTAKAEALEALVAAIGRARGYGPHITIDMDGFLHHAAPAEGQP